MAYIPTNGKALEDFYGRRLKIIGDHPHVDELGTIIDAEYTLSGWGFVVRLDSGSSCFVYKPENVEWED